jgi:hypothetical protein
LEEERLEYEGSFSMGILLARIERIRLVASPGALLLYAYILSLALIMVSSMRHSLKWDFKFIP